MTIARNREGFTSILQRMDCSSLLVAMTNQSVTPRGVAKHELRRIIRLLQATFVGLADQLRDCQGVR